MLKCNVGKEAFSHFPTMFPKASYQGVANPFSMELIKWVKWGGWGGGGGSLSGERAGLMTWWL